MAAAESVGSVYMGQQFTSFFPLVLSLLNSGSWVQPQTPEMDLGVQTSTCSQLLGS